jgi:hypothetical protein
MHLKKLQKNFSMPKKEREETSKINENNIFKITGLVNRLSEAEKKNNSKSLIIEELKAENGKEGVPKTLLASTLLTSLIDAMLPGFTMGTAITACTRPG